MVDNLGRWTPEPDYSTYPKEKWCDMDRVAAWIMEQGYKPKTSMENLINMCILYFEGEMENEYAAAYDDDGDIMIENLAIFVEESGGLKEFDYEC